jgi:hypothetical protein
MPSFRALVVSLAWAAARLLSSGELARAWRDRTSLEYRSLQDRLEVWWSFLGVRRSLSRGETSSEVEAALEFIDALDSAWSQQTAADLSALLERFATG